MDNAQNEQANVQNDHSSELEQLREGESEQMQIRREKLQKIYDLGVTPFGQKFDWTHHNQQIIDEFAELEEQEVAIAGRIMAIRDHGKTAFLNLRDFTGDIQVYLRQDEVSELECQLFQLLDIGDIVGINGKVFKTHKGEITVRVEKLTLLSKGLRPLPNKWQGLKDPEIRYRQRYVDLIMNPQVRDTFKKRSQIINCIREWLTDHGFMEVETPMMQTIYGGAAARPFITHHNAHNMDVYMRISPELYLKRLVVGGFERVFEINRNFRNEGIDNRHNPEFTMLETYQAYGNFEDAIYQTEQIVSYCAQKVLGTMKINYQGTEIDLTPPWNRMTMPEAVKKFSGEDFDQVETIEEARAIADRLGAEYTEHDGIGKILNACFEEVAEEKLIQPTFIFGHPLEISPLAKQNKENPSITDRFEAFIFGRELANGYSELNDPIDQRGRFEQQMREFELGDDEAHQMDEDFVAALEYGLPPTGGLGIGIDRMIMFLTDAPSIRDVILFPLMRPEEGRAGRGDNAEEASENEEK